MADWKNELSGIMGNKAHASRAEQENARFEAFLDEVARPALEAVADELAKNHGREAQVRRAPATVTLQVHNGTEEEITFRVMKHFVQSGILPSAEVRLNKSTQFVKYECMFKPGPPNYPIASVTQDEIIHCFIKYYGMVMGGPNA